MKINLFGYSFTITKNPHDISSRTNSRYGSTHWFNTIIANIIHISHYISEHPEKVNKELLATWNKEIYQGARELSDNFTTKILDIVLDTVWIDKGTFTTEKHVSEVRLATSDEIKKAVATEVFVIAEGFEVEIKNGKVFHKNSNITQYVKSVRDFWKSLNEGKMMFDNYAFSIEDITLEKTGCQSIKHSIHKWLEIASKIC